MSHCVADAPTALVSTAHVNSSNPALRGETITFYATGLGQTVPEAATGVPELPGLLLGSPMLFISAVYQANAIGVYAVTIQIPVSTHRDRRSP